MINKSTKQAFYFCLTALVASGCSSSSSESGFSEVDLRFSDAPVDSASEVVITVDRITFRPVGEREDVVVDLFNGELTNEQMDTNAGNDNNVDQAAAANTATDFSGSDTYTIDLLTVQGNDSRLVLDDVQLPVGDYANMLIDVIDEGIENSYVTDATGVKPLKVPSQTLKLGGFTITPNSKQSMVVEFGLQQSMTYNPGPDRYILKPRGIRIVSVDEASMVSGNIDHSALQAFEQCEALGSGGTAGKIYLYEGHSLNVTKLADNFDPALLPDQNDMVAPIASSSLDANGYILSYIEPGNYTLVVSCHTESDDAELLEGLSIPNPAAQLIEMTLAQGDSLDCAVPLEQSTCAASQNLLQ